MARPNLNVNTTETTNENRAMTQEQIDAIANKMGEELKKAEKIKVKLPIIDKNDLVVEVCLNGYNVLIKRGELVELPKPIVEILEHAGLL